MKTRLLTMLMLMVLTITAFAQDKKQHKKAARAKTETVTEMPGWYVAHGDKAPANVYFPDYYTFYDASRQGFVYWGRDKWEFSPTVPLYLKNVDLSKSRIKLLKGLSLDLHPEENYPNYMKMYPAEPTGEPIQVPVPNIQHK